MTIRATFRVSDDCPSKPFRRLNAVRDGANLMPEISAAICSNAIFVYRYWTEQIEE